MSKAGLTAALVIVIAPMSLAPARAAVDPEAAVVDELVVTARIPGPAWWRVAKGDSVVWVLGLPAGLPKGLKWNTHALDQHLADARQVIFPPVNTAGVFDIPGLLSLRAKMKSRTPLEDSLPPDLRARFVADAQALNRNPGRYDHWNGLVAGLLMFGDFLKTANLDFREPLPSIERDARGHGRKPRPAAIYKGMPVLKAGAKELTSAIEQDCLSEALDEIEGGAERQVHAAEGWTRGDVKLALTGSAGFNHCVNLLPVGAQASRRAMADEAGAVAAALDQPGSAVAVLPLRQLLAEDGVLQQLKARGYEIRAPDR